MSISLVMSGTLRWQCGLWFEIDSPPPPPMDVVIQIIATSFIFALFLEQVKQMKSLTSPGIERSMSTTYKFSFSKSCLTEVTQVVMLTPEHLHFIYLSTEIVIAADPH